MRFACSVLRANESGDPVYVKITSAITRTQRRTMVEVINLETREPHSMVVKTVLGNELHRAYPDNGYIGRCFAIDELAPQNGKLYSGFKIDEIELQTAGLPEEATPESSHRPHNGDGQGSTEFVQAEERDNQTSKEVTLADAEGWWRSPTDRDWHDWYNNVYLKTKHWAKIRRRIIKRDGKVCRRCGGRCGGSAAAIHHRSYSDRVMQGLDDEQLVLLCDGCHTVIHFDESGNKRSPEETDRLLLAKDESEAVPPVKVDLRKRWPTQPVEWKRMTALQRALWEQEYRRQWFIGKVKRKNDPAVTEANRGLLRMYGMDDAAIDSAMRSPMLRPRQKGA